ncbi:MAG: type VI secretion system baseplate subunit TssG, partial [Desulfobacterales bacterium]
MEDMAPQSRGADHLLEKRLFAESWRFDFYQAVRLLEMLHPDRQAVGETADTQKESLRFCSSVDLDFPASDVCAISQNGSDASPIRMEVSFMGLAGHHGVLPPPYTELIQERVRKKDTALRDFLDMFNHRFISLLYRVRKMNRIAFDGKNAEQSHFARYLFCLMGMGTEGLQNRMRVKDR